MKNIAILALATALLTGGFARAQDRVQGTWSNTVIGLGTSTWIFTPTGNNHYSAQESGLGTARGTAILNGNQLRIDFTFNGGAGYYILTVNDNGTASGTATHTRGANTGRSWSVTMRRTAGGMPNGLVWRESETSGNLGTFYGNWTWDAGKGQFIARWNNNAQAVLRIVSDDGTNVVLRRYDPSGSSTSMTAEYVGQRIGNTIRGTVTWYYRGGKNTGTWSASW